MKQLLSEVDPENDSLYEFYLNSASSVICEIRNTDAVESKYEYTQIKIAIELYNKRGVEGQTGHSENGINRTYEASNISSSLLSEITPVVKTPFSSVRNVQ